MDFFRVPPRPERPLNLPKVPHWIHTPSDEIGVLVPHAAVIARSEKALVALAGFHVYSNGAEILLMLRTLSDFVLEDPTGVRELMRRRIDPSHDPLPDTVFRFGVEFSDGRRATSLDTNWMDPDWHVKPPPSIHLGMTGGGGGAAFDWQFWLWPLPPTGVLTLVSEYPHVGIALTRYEIETSPLLEAASQSIKLWEDAT
jgi:hypothetical protein